MSATHPPETNNGVITSWIPLTTGWSDVPGCSSEYMLYVSPDYTPYPNGEDMTISRFVAFDALWGIAVRMGNVCLPNEFTIWQTQFYSGNYIVDEYSTGNSLTLTSLLPLSCPDAWSTVATFVRSSISTQVMCCPPTYFLSNLAALSTGVEGICVSKIDCGSKLTYAHAKAFHQLLPSELSFYLNNLYITPSITRLKARVTAQAAAIVGWNVQPTASSTSNPTTGQPSANGYELSSGAKAGIGVAGGFGILIFIALLAWTVTLKRKVRNLSADINISKESQIQSSSTDSIGVSNSPRSCELESSQINELSHRSLGELDGSQINELSPIHLCEVDSVSVPPVGLVAKSPKTSPTVG